MYVKPLDLTTQSPDIEERVDKPRSRLRRLSTVLSKKRRFVLDVIVLMVAFYFAYLLRFDFEISRQQVPYMLAQLTYVLAIQIAMLALFGVYGFIWRYIGMAEMQVFLKSVCVAALPILMLRYGLPESLKQWRVPVSIIIMDTILAFGGVLGLRVLRRVLYERYEKRHKANQNGNGHKKSVLLIGAGRAGILTVREVLGRGMDLNVKGFVDDDPHKQGSVIYGIKVLGTTRDLPRLVRENGIEYVVITIAEAPRRDIRRIVELCESIPVGVQIIPGLYEILQGNVEISRIRDVQIEDLLGREPVHLDEDDMSEFLAGKTVMVTGAGGSIGTELVRQVARFKPARLLLVERAEFALFNIDRELRITWPELSIVPLVADVGDEGRMRSIFRTYRPHVVLHAAAHKHVPMMETNVGEAVKNNVLNTHLLAEMSGVYEVESFVLISTDKAVRPTSLMGACKRVAELVVQDLNQCYATRYVAVRFGNVMGSAGSVIPIFREQILNGGPVTITHPDMIRYFMTIPEAAQLVLQAGAMGEGGEIFILDMGEPVRILDLAKEMIILSGLKPFEDIEITFTGSRPGEKLVEELEISEEGMTRTYHPKIFIGKIATYPAQKVHAALDRLRELSKTGEDQEFRIFFKELLPESQLNGNGEPAGAGSESDLSRRTMVKSV